MDSWYVTYTTGRALHEAGETQGKGWTLKAFPNRHTAIEFAQTKRKEGCLGTEAGTLPGVAPAEKLTNAELEKLGLSDVNEVR
jgi:hypothetical protein